MKNARTIISSLVGQTHFKSLTQHRCYKKYIQLMPPRFREAIAFMTVKNGNLMIALSHPGYKMELNYNKELLKSLLSTLVEHEEECAFMETEKIIIFVSGFHRAEEKISTETVPRYAERAKGDFSAEPSNGRLKEIFDKIRRDIARNLSE